MSLPVGRIQCRKHPGYIGAHMRMLSEGDGMACDFIYFMRKRKVYVFPDESHIEVRKLVLRKKKK